jgi:hypothetical protein
MVNSMAMAAYKSRRACAPAAVVLSQWREVSAAIRQAHDQYWALLQVLNYALAVDIPWFDSLPPFQGALSYKTNPGMSIYNFLDIQKTRPGQLY